MPCTATHSRRAMAAFLHAVVLTSCINGEYMSCFLQQDLASTPNSISDTVVSSMA